MSRQSDFVTLARQEARRLWEALNALEALQKEWNALDYGNTLGAEAFAGQNDHLNALQVGAVVFDTAAAIRAQFDAGHATNVARLL